jgi:hypothetical protein
MILGLGAKNEYLNGWKWINMKKLGWKNTRKKKPN